MGVLNGNKITSMLINDPDLKLSIYRQTIITLWLIASMVLAAMYFNNDELDLVGAGFVSDVESMLLLVGACLAFLAAINLVKPSKKMLDWLGRVYERVLYLVPATPTEYRWSLLLSATAGFCEELIFRGFLFEQLNMYLGELWALLVTNLIFAFCHWGTGYKNALWSFGLGIAWSISYLQTGSLWFAICIHIVVDISSMTLGRHAIVKQSTSNLSNL